MSKRIKFVVPDSFVESLNELIIRVREGDEEVEKQAIAIRQVERERQERLKEESIKKGLKHAEYIFAWSEAFRESEIGRTLIRIGHSSVYGVYIFDGQVLGKPWRGIGVGEKWECIIKRIEKRRARSKEFQQMLTWFNRGEA